MKSQTRPLYEVRVDGYTYRISTSRRKAQELQVELARKNPTLTVELVTSQCCSNETHLSLDTLLVSATMLGLFILILASFLSACNSF